LDEKGLTGRTTKGTEKWERLRKSKDSFQYLEKPTTEELRGKHRKIPTAVRKVLLMERTAEGKKGKKIGKKDGTITGRPRNCQLESSSESAITCWKGIRGKKKRNKNKGGTA